MRGKPPFSFLAATAIRATARARNTVERSRFVFERRFLAVRGTTMVAANGSEAASTLRATLAKLTLPS